ncbi:MAG: SDR family oxidoreductase [Actinomycetota bacterium]
MSSLALITGAASGIGAEVARRLAGRGYTVVCVDRNVDLAEHAAIATGSDAIAVACDLSDTADVSSLCDRIRGEWAVSLDVLVCNAGIIAPTDVADLTDVVIDRHLDIMLRSPMAMIAAAVPAMVRRNTGHILATVSMGGVVAMPGSSAYSAAKAGLRAFLTSLHAELAETDVKVSGVYPNAVDTPMLRQEAADGGSALNFVGAVLTVDDVADAYERALDRGRLEYYVPYSDSIGGRLLAAKPALIPALVPALNRIGERGRDRYMASPIPPGSSRTQTPDLRI